MKKRNSYSSLHYCLILLAGIIVILAVYYLCPEKKPEETESAETASQSEETISSIETEIPTSESTDGSDSETSSASPALDPASFEILDSKYQYAQGYAWDDLYALLVLIVKTSNIPEGMNPAFSLVRLSKNYDPMLLVGYQDKKTRDIRYTVYITDAGYVYELAQFTGTVKVSASEQAFFLPDKDEKLIYLPHVFLKTEILKDPSDLTDLIVHDLEGTMVSAEELARIVQDFTEQ